jgi:phosphate transport system substrate-binding protein
MRVLTAILLAVTVAFVSCGRSRLNEVTVAGSTSIQPFAEMLAEDFMARNPGIRVMVQGGGSTAGVQAVREGAAQIGTVSRALNDQERDLMPIVIARDGIAVIVHPSNPVDNLTMEQVRGMFAGRTKEFPDTGARKCPVRPVTREEGSGTRGAFEELVMREDAITPRALVQDSNGSMREVVTPSRPCGLTRSRLPTRT